MFKVSLFRKTLLKITVLVKKSIILQNNNFKVTFFAKNDPVHVQIKFWSPDLMNGNVFSGFQWEAKQSVVAVDVDDLAGSTCQPRRATERRTHMRSTTALCELSDKQNIKTDRKLLIETTHSLSSSVGCCSISGRMWIKMKEVLNLSWIEISLENGEKSLFILKKIYIN